MKTVGCFAPGFIQPVTGLRIGVVLGGFRVGAGFPVDARWFGNREAVLSDFCNLRMTVWNRNPWSRPSPPAVSAEWIPAPIGRIGSCGGERCASC
jgi:hypothetical protein